MARETRKRGAAKKEQQPALRGWPFSLVTSAVIVTISIVASATINPLFGRSVHWDWVAGIVPVSFILMTLAFRRRWF
jgi:hypothetical protein